jgi:hypothetical protein
MSICTRHGNYIRCLLRTVFLAVHTIDTLTDNYLLSKKGKGYAVLYRVAIREDKSTFCLDVRLLLERGPPFFSYRSIQLQHRPRHVLFSYQKVTMVLYLFSLLHFLPSVWTLPIPPDGKGAKYDDIKNFGPRPNIPCVVCMVSSVGTWPRGWTNDQIYFYCVW